MPGGLLVSYDKNVLDKGEGISAFECSDGSIDNRRLSRRMKTIEAHPTCAHLNYA